MKTKKNLWPFAIIATFALFICGTVSLVVFACSQKMDLVSSDYYEQEIGFQRHLDGLERATRVPRPASIVYDAATRSIRVSLHVDPGTAIRGHVHLYRASAAGLDRHFSLALNPQGIQSFDASGLCPGLWKVRMGWTMHNEEFFIERQIVVTANQAPKVGRPPVG